jgi:uroporphyrinogen decarboxylase
MNARERVLSALDHREPDRVPIDLGGSPVTGISAVAYNQLKQQLELDDDPVKVANIILQLARIEEPVRQRLGVDVIGLPMLEPLPGVYNLDWKPWTLPDGSEALVAADFGPEETPDGDLLIRTDDGAVAQRMSAGTYHFVPEDPWLDEASWEALERFQPPRLSEKCLTLLHRAAHRLHDETDYAIFGWFGGSLVENAQLALGWMAFMQTLRRDPNLIAALVKRLADAALDDLARYLDAVGDVVHVIGFGDDLGTQAGLQFSPEHYRELFKPHHRRLYDLVHKRSEARVFLHSCGSVYKLIPDLIEVGVDVLNPVQTSAEGMAPARLKEEFGEQLTFWGGGCSAQHVLPWATPEKVEEAVRERLETLAPGGGYVFAPTHDIQHDVPIENVVAMYEAARQHGRYPLG